MSSTCPAAARHWSTKTVKAAYPQTQLITNAPTANARGYLHYARFVGRQS